jgi:glyoxylase-like metal-dependent hydrolase (beta-lactamase superfamily II)
MNGAIPLEDNWSDVIRKARRGLRISEEELARRSMLTPEDIIALENGIPDLGQLKLLAGALGLEQSSLLALAQGEYHPGPLRLPPGVAIFSTPWDDFEVHSYLVWDPGLEAKGDAPAAAFDTGSDVSEMLGFLKAKALVLGQIFLTHGHGDHVFDLDRLVDATGALALIGEKEMVPGVQHFQAGDEFSVGNLRIETRSTWGHSPGGISYVIHGLERPVAIVGDALFAGSMGGPMISYEACLDSDRQQIFSLSPETLLCPGHGPLTTVALEGANNPFFA